MSQCTHHITRRSFIAAAGAAAAAATVGYAQPSGEPQPYEARYYDPVGDGAVQCTLCPWQCTVANGERGKCNVRENTGGRLYSLVYGRPCTINNDPIEKKPFFHVYPRSRALSIATVGCSINCTFCQNWEISQAKPEDTPVPYRTPESIVQLAKAQHCRTIAYTYSEPTIFFEYMVDCAKLAKKNGIGNIMVSNGFICEDPLTELASLMTAIKIDFKAFSQQFYGTVCKGRLRPVLDTLKRLKDSGVWYEIVVLVIPTLNDNMDEIKRMSEWIVTNLGTNVPLHFTRFHPAYKLRNLPPTPPRTLNRARKTAMKQGINYVYGGNIPGMKSENTYCPSCKSLIIDRHGHAVLSDEMKSGKCHKCATPIPGIWS